MKTYVFNVTWIDRSGLSFTRSTRWNIAWCYNFLKIWCSHPMNYVQLENRKFARDFVYKSVSECWGTLQFSSSNMGYKWCYLLICNECSFIIILNLVIKQSFHSQIHYFKDKWNVCKSNELKSQNSKDEFHGKYRFYRPNLIFVELSKFHGIHPSCYMSKPWTGQSSIYKMV